MRIILWLVAELVGRLSVHRLLGKRRVVVWLDCFVINNASFWPRVKAWGNLGHLQEAAAPAVPLLVRLALAECQNQQERNESFLAIKLINKIGRSARKELVEAVGTMLDKLISEKAFEEAGERVRWFARFMDGDDVASLTPQLAKLSEARRASRVPAPALQESAA